MTVLVTGGAGYIGSHIVKELVNRNKNVVVLDNLQTGYRSAIKDIEFVLGDISDEKLVTEIISKYDIDQVVHFAADSLVGESMQNPSKYYYNNVVKTIKLLNTMIKKDVKKIVFSSTAAVYGEPDKMPVTEDCQTAPTNVYGRTKLMIETLLKDYDQAYGLKSISLRYFNASGAHEDGTIGEGHNPETHLIPIIMKVILGQRDKIEILGDDYPTKDGTCIRDYIHVTDLAIAHILALESLKCYDESNIYNLGNNLGYSVKEIINAVEKVTGHQIRKEIVTRRPGDPAVLIASFTKIQTELGWYPKYNLTDIIRTAWKWHANHPNGYDNTAQNEF